MSIKDQLKIVGNYLEIKQSNAFLNSSNSYTEVLKLDKIQKIEYIKNRSLILRYESLDRNNEICIRSDNYDEAYNLIINALGSLKIVPDYETKSM